MSIYEMVGQHGDLSAPVLDGSPVATRYNAALLPPLRRAVRNIAFVYVGFHSAYSRLGNLAR
jgi:hypothetical protein